MTTSADSTPLKLMRDVRAIGLTADIHIDYPTLINVRWEATNNYGERYWKHKDWFEDITPYLSISSSLVLAGGTVRITTSTPQNFREGQHIFIQQHVGNTFLNDNIWTVKITDPSEHYKFNLHETGGVVGTAGTEGIIRPVLDLSFTDIVSGTVVVVDANNGVTYPQENTTTGVTNWHLNATDGYLYVGPDTTGFTWGTWNSGVSYVATNIVLYSSVAYICVLANTNKPPPNTQYWKAFTEIPTHTDLLVKYELDPDTNDATDVTVWEDVTEIVNKKKHHMFCALNGLKDKDGNPIGQVKLTGQNFCLRIQFDSYGGVAKIYKYRVDFMYGGHSGGIPNEA